MKHVGSFFALGSLLCLRFVALGAAFAENEAGLSGIVQPGGEPVVRIEMDSGRAGISFLGWDTEGGNRARVNLLRSPVGVRVRTDGTWREGAELPTQREKVGDSGIRYVLGLGNGGELVWDVASGSGRMTMGFGVRGARAGAVESLELAFPFNVRAAATTVMPADWTDDGKLVLPAIICAPDLGQMLVSCEQHPDLKGRLEGSRAKHTVDFIVELPGPGEGETYALELRPVWLPAPKGFKDEGLWRAARRGWFNILQPSARWGSSGRPFSAPPGILANNVVSDPVSCLIHLYADQAFFTPEIEGISLAALVRRTVDYWILDKTRPTGEVVAYWDYGDMLDANASPLIAAWDYVESTGDKAWLEKRIERLEFVADYLAKRDVDGDGLVECTHSGNSGTLVQPARSASAYDTINAGWKDAYSNALTYRAWRCLADLDAKLARTEQQGRYAKLADGIRAVYVKTLLDPATGWIAWWKSEDGELHNLASPMINGLAIEYGLIEPAQARDILSRLWKKIEEVGFTRFDLGVPITLVPVRRDDYLLPTPGHGVCGAPEREDGADTFGKYLNGGCLVSDAVHFMTALYMVGEREKADRILRAMLERQVRGVFPNGGAFQNGVVDAYPRGAEFFDWSGNTCGYEGHLTYSFSFLQTVLLREPEFRARLFRPLTTP